jgi:hypothetical protein
MIGTARPVDTPIWMSVLLLLLRVMYLYTRISRIVSVLMYKSHKLVTLLRVRAK